MNWNQSIRQTHRWLSLAFTAAVLANAVTVLRGKYSPRLGLVAVFFLGLMFVTGMYLFVLPYVARWRRPTRAKDPVQSLDTER